jgi:hypothetical protein
MDFLDTITNKKQEYEITIGNELKFIGTKPEFKDLISELDEEWHSQLSPLLVDKQEYTTPFELTQLEIYNYLEKTTSNFDPIKVKLILNEFEVYYTMDLSERINQESLNIYTKEGWEIPQIELKPLILKDGSRTIDHLTDYKTMRRKTHLFAYWNIDFAIGVLKDKLKDNDTTKESLKPSSPVVTNLHPQIFNDGGYDLFSYLVQNYISDGKTPKAKFSYLFQYLKHEQLIVCTQLQYISFIEKEYKVKLSKILHSDYKFSDQIQPILGRLRSNFQKSLKP